jgi:hypothetical protein
MMPMLKAPMYRLRPRVILSKTAQVGWLVGAQAPASSLRHKGIKFCIKSKALKYSKNRPPDHGKAHISPQKT